MITTTQNPEAAQPIQSVFDMVQNGGPLMWPLALCSVVALAFVVERAIRLRESELGSRRYGRSIVDALAARGPAGALAVVSGERRPLGRVLEPALNGNGTGRLEREKAVEDAGAREVQRLSANLKPLMVVGILAPLLGFLGTVFGMIQCFAEISLRQGLAKPEQLAAGISQALITTAAGLCIAIPTQTAYFWLKARIERFVRRAEDLYGELAPQLDRSAPAALTTGGAA